MWDPLLCLTHCCGVNGTTGYRETAAFVDLRSEFSDDVDDGAVSPAASSDSAADGGGATVHEQ